MKIRLCLLTMLCLYGVSAHAAFLDCLFIDGFDGETSSAPAQWQANIKLHNCARSTVSPAAHPALSTLSWNASVAKTAQNYANQCAYAHSNAPGLGENLYAITPPTTAAYTSAASSWASEFAYYDYATNTCANDEMCGHYTQMVWRNTSQLGCGLANCSVNSPWGSSFPDWTLVVCNYSPPGNYIGQKPY